LWWWKDEFFSRYRGEVEVFGTGVESSFTIEDAEGTQRVSVGMGVQKRSERLWRDEHGRYGIFEPRKVLAVEVTSGGVGSATELVVEFALEEKRFTQYARNGKDQLRVGHVWQHLLYHSLGPDDGALLATARTKTANLTRVRNKFVFAAVLAHKPHEAEVWIAATKKPLEEIAKTRVKGPVA
jgi:hypothetical protein